ncbi:MAG: glycosyltransferase [Lachnospiraceae bacterium]|nr:glycosyltransferase [Lachnospiraceae bacterium]
MEYPLVSILIRTHQRPEILKTALNSIRKQTYPHIQVVVVEDGENTAETLLQKEYGDLEYIYESTGEKVGRCKAGNRALELASGEFFNFLDDDDELFADHIETLVNKISKSSCIAAYSVAEERQIVIHSLKPYVFQIKRKIIRFRQPFNRLILYSQNYLPIQSVLFSRKLFQKLGGFDECLDTLEDWDLWVRYSTQTDFLFVNEITSCYYTPHRRREKQKRSDGLKDYLKPLHEKFKTYPVSTTVENVNQDMMYVIREYKSKGIIRYLRIFFRTVFLGER